MNGTTNAGALLLILLQEQQRLGCRFNEWLQAATPA